MRKIRSAVYFCFVVKNYKKDQNCYSVRYIFINKNSICEDEFMNIMIAFGIASIMSVSYTHLDLFHRPVLYRR